MFPVDAPIGMTASGRNTYNSVGLLRSAFRPEQQVCAVRSVWRQRAELVAMASQHIQHMHKALTQMNLQIHHVMHIRFVDSYPMTLSGKVQTNRLA